MLISFSTPVTFYCYHRMVQGFDESEDDDLVTGKPGGNSRFAISRSEQSLSHQLSSGKHYRFKQKCAVQSMLLSRAPDHSVPIKNFCRMVFVALLLSVTTIVGPTKIFPLCPPADMKVGLIDGR